MTELFEEVYEDEIQFQKTAIFVDRYFRQMSFEAIAKKHGMTAKEAKTVYHNAKKRLQRAIELMDNQDFHARAYKTAQTLSSKTEDLSRKQKHFLLHALFGLTFSDIAEITGDGKEAIKQNVAKARKDVRNGYFFLRFDTNRNVLSKQLSRTIAKEREQVL